MEEEDYEEEEGFHEDVFEVDNEPIFNTYQSEEEFVFRNEKTVIDDEPIFDIYLP